METNIKTITINGIKYVEVNDNLLLPVSNKEGLKYVIIRSYGAGVFCGYLKSQETKEGVTNCVLLESKRIHYWNGAASLSQLAIDGTSDPKNCRVPVAIPEHEIKNVIEIIPMTAKAKETIEKVPLWKV